MVEANFNQDIKTKPNSSVCSVNISGLDTKIPSTSLELRRKVICLIREVLSTVQSFYHEDVVELNFIQSGSLLIEFYEWRRKNTQELMQALCSGHLDPEDLALVSEFMSGHISGDVVFPPNGSFNPSLPPQLTLEHDSEDDDDERRLDENSLLKCAMEEVNVFKRVLELKRAGLWSADDSSCGAAGPGNDNPTNISLAPPPEPTCRTLVTICLRKLIGWLRISNGNVNGNEFPQKSLR
ncbi:unnamed protein product [Heterobilharzia americana]|nr:unnamed protein product [Heterobilharzia americana]